MTDYIINPTKFRTPHADAESKEALIELIKTTPSPFLVSGYYPITFKEKPALIYLTHSLLIRQRAHNSAGCRIEVLQHKKPIKGGFSSIYTSLGVLLPESDYLFKRRREPKSRICKIIPITESFDEKMIEQESSYTQMNQLLHCKKPVFDSKQGYLVMKKVGNHDLFDFLNALDARTITLSIEQKLHLTHAIIRAVKEQVHDLGMIHTDLKPENIMVDEKTLDAVVIDYGFAQPINEPLEDDSVHGSLLYLAPEILFDNTRSIKSDSFALGLTIAQIWGYLFEIEITPDTEFSDAYEFLKNRTWTHLFEHVELSTSLKHKMIQVFDALTEFEPRNRIVSAHALQLWEDIINEFKASQGHSMEPKPPAQKSTLSRSPLFFSLASCASSSSASSSSDDAQKSADPLSSWRRDSC
ncbi:protein kinase domain-containing protein [Legionella worsleiensis]|uniref:Protein kinase domain-containing protein n=1 Tax=Legionella worsleiensis TaxID=45076 RepID=A0A0W1A6M0_9GAMM|nr:protein kinase [Legionella worsleiensis]KTD76848.1 putative protein kinase [Legionella worsleiensis]STY30727.1 Serine/threonine protein kinase [Legionella worsleiensis]